MITRTVLLTAIAMIAFAANSLLCRLALGSKAIDAASFSSVRVISGAVMLGLILAFRRKSMAKDIRPNWRAAIALATYMVCFSFAYISLSAGTGALILFGAVQLTMLFYAHMTGERLSWFGSIGLALAVFGFVYLVSPGVAAPNVLAAGIMAAAGIAWAVYTLYGRGAHDPAMTTTTNFFYAIPLTLIPSALLLRDFAISPSGLALAIASGAFASGCGYVIWYRILPTLSAIRSSSVQLSVPAIASFGGATVLSEEITFRLLVSSLAIIGGVAMVFAQRAAAPAP